MDSFHGSYPFSSPASVDSCMSSPKRNVTVLITNVYEGIPETLTLNVICWLCLLLLFALLRRNAWNYGRLALVQGTNKWTHLFYGTANEAETPDAENAQDSFSFIDARYCSWVPAVFQLSREQIKSRCGPDAVHYLSFQRHLITLLFIMMLLCICIILPINFQGSLEGDDKTFGHTTVANLEPQSQWLWIHAIIGIAYLPITIMLMRRSTGRKPLPDYATRAIMITNIDKRHRNRDTIKDVLHQKFPDINILDLQIAYNTKNLQKIDEKREIASKAKVFSESHAKKGEPIKVRMSLFGKKVDAIPYYTLREKRFTDEMERQKARALNDPLGIAFVTLSSYQEVENVIQSFTPSSHHEWTISNAPAPTDIFWENLDVEPNVWYFKAFFLNTGLFIVLFFLTTPAIIVNMIDAFYIEHDSVIQKISPVVSEFLPTLLLWTMAAMLPVIVSYSDQLLSYWTRSKLTYSIMVKTFSFLLLMTLVLPSLGLTSAQAFVEWTLQRDNGTYRWECVFLPDKGAFFVNYVITSAFIGTALELIRFSELCLFTCYMCRAKSKAEKAYVQKAILLEFPFGVHYAWTLVVFTITTVYSLACPLITPFGLVYLLLKHFGDKYNLFFAYKSSDMSGVDGGKIHATAVRMVRVSILLLQISMAALAGLRGGMDARTIILIIFTLITLGMLFMLSPFPNCTKPPAQTRDFHIQSKYIAPVLLKSISSISLRPQSDYGSSDGGELSNNSMSNVVNL
ncbi:transmembrane protein 63 [Arctopsyche grandis]|uniref:transmembrane protein 63 n=1 Tax=Arctopsyche grandis TaxID=121162 RepID=UPI00406D97A5